MKSINLWNVWAAFLRMKGIHRNSHNPNGVITAVLGMSSGLTGIWWYPLTRSTLENIFFPARFAVKSWIVGIGY